MRQLLIAVSLSVVGLATSAWADDWVAQTLRGEAVVWVDNHWVKLKPGDVVNNSNVVRTTGNGHIEFARDRETVALGPDTQIQIFDRTGQRYTTVIEAFGSVRVEANVENVKHFTVQTPFLAATVKGTIFTVVSGSRAANVQVQRGKVGVDDVLHGLHVDVLPGQIASAGREKPLQIAGEGNVEPVLNTADQPESPKVNKGKVKGKSSNGDDNDNGDDKGKSKGNNGKGNSGKGNNGNGGKGNNGNGGNGGDGGDKDD